MSKTLEAPRLPLVVRPSRSKPWFGFLAMVGFVAIGSLTRPANLKPAALLMGGVFLAIVALICLAPLLDRRPRLVLDHDGLHWRKRPGDPLRFTPWEQLRGVGYRSDPHHHDTGWLELDIAGPDAPRGALRASILVRGLSPWGEDLPDIVRAIAPHVSLIDFDD